MGVDFLGDTRIVLEIGDHHMGAGGDEAFRYRQTDAADSAGDERILVADIEHVLNPHRACSAGDLTAAMDLSVA